MKYYEESRLKKIGTGTWLAETGKLVERMVTMDEKDVPARLFQAQLLIREERAMKPDGSWITRRTCWKPRELPAENSGLTICI